MPLTTNALCLTCKAVACRAAAVQHVQVDERAALSSPAHTFHHHPSIHTTPPSTPPLPFPPQLSPAPCISPTQQSPTCPAHLSLRHEDVQAPLLRQPHWPRLGCSGCRSELSTGDAAGVGYLQAMLQAWASSPAAAARVEEAWVLQLVHASTSCQHMGPHRQSAPSQRGQQHNSRSTWAHTGSRPHHSVASSRLPCLPCALR